MRARRTPRRCRHDLGSLTPKATGEYPLHLVVEAAQGPSVHSVGTIVVHGTTGGWSLAFMPTLLVAALAVVHVAWRRLWVG